MQVGKGKKRPCGICIMAMIAFVLLVIRSKYGFSYEDEPFLLTLTQRLYYGDSLFIDEWNFAQNVAVLLLPFYRLYMAIFKSVDGILLVFRGLYCFFWVLTCTILYSVLQGKYKMAWVVYLYLLLFSPLDQMILSYTSIGLMCILLLGTLFYRHLAVKPLKFRTFTLLFSALTITAVIASPFLVLIYGLYVLGIIVLSLWKRTEQTKFFMKSVLWSVAIAFGALVLYVWRFVLNNYSIAEAFEMFPQMFASSSVTTDVLERGTSLIWNVVGFWRYQFLMAGITFVATLIPKIRKSTFCRIVLFSANALVFGYEMLLQFSNKGNAPYFNLQMAPVVYFGATAWWLLNDKKKDGWLFGIFTGLGVCYSGISYVSSNTGLPAFCMGIAVCGVAGILMVWELAQELASCLQNDRGEETTAIRKRINWLCRVFCFGVAVLVFMSQILTQSHQKANRHYWDCPVPEMDGEITIGASEGIFALEWSANMYNKRMEALEQLLQYVDMEEREKIRLLSLIFEPDVYLNANVPVGGYSVWTYSLSEEGKPKVYEKMDRYYALHPDKIPNVIFGSEIEDYATIRMPNIDITGYEKRSYGEYYIYIAPEFLKE